MVMCIFPSLFAFLLSFKRAWLSYHLCQHLYSADSSPGVLESEAELQRALTIKVEQACQPDFNCTSTYQNQTMLMQLTQKWNEKYFFESIRVRLDPVHDNLESFTFWLLVPNTNA